MGFLLVCAPASADMGLGGRFNYLPTPIPPTPQPTFSYTAPTPIAVPTQVPTPIVPTPVPTIWPTAAPTAVPTLAPPTPQPTPNRLSAVYDPASLAAAATRCDTVAVTGIASGVAVIANPGVNPAVGCLIQSVRASATNTVSVCWRNAFAATTACDTASSTWAFVQP
jgi:hypothetical protein